MTFALEISQYRKYLISGARKAFSLSTEDAEDIVQDVLLKAIANENRFDPDKGKLKTWLFRGLMFMAFNRTKTERVRKNVLRNLPLRIDTSFIQVEEQITGKYLIAAIQKLSPTERRMIILRYVGDMSYREIQDRLQINKVKVGVTLGRAKTKLRRHLMATGMYAR